MVIYRYEIKTPAPVRILDPIHTNAFLFENAEIWCVLTYPAH